MSLIPLDIHPRFVSACYLGWTCQTNWTTSSLGEAICDLCGLWPSHFWRLWWCSNRERSYHRSTNGASPKSWDTSDATRYKNLQSGYHRHLWDMWVHGYTYKPSRGVKCSAGKAKHWPTGDPWGPSFGWSETMEIIPRRDGHKEYLKPPTNVQ